MSEVAERDKGWGASGSPAIAKDGGEGECGGEGEIEDSKHSRPVVEVQEPAEAVSSKDLGRAVVNACSTGGPQCV